MTRMLTKIGNRWIDLALVTAVEPYMDDPAKPRAVVTLTRKQHIVSVTADDAATAINQALEKWKGYEGCANQ
jgi:hypothetical protein